MNTPHEIRQNDWRLVEKIRAGDATALEAMYAQYVVRLCAYAWRWTEGRAIAEEIVQDVFLNIWANRTEFEVSESVATYLFRAVRNRVLNHLRHERIRREHRFRVARSDVPGEVWRAMAADEQVVQQELHDAVGMAIKQLPVRSREIFLLNREQGLTYTQIAEVMHISVKTVEYHMGRAFTLLRRQLADWAVL